MQRAAIIYSFSLLVIFNYLNIHNLSILSLGHFGLFPVLTSVDEQCYEYHCACLSTRVSRRSWEVELLSHGADLSLKLLGNVKPFSRNGSTTGPGNPPLLQIRVNTYKVSHSLPTWWVRSPRNFTFISLLPRLKTLQTLRQHGHGWRYALLFSSLSVSVSQRPSQF